MKLFVGKLVHGDGIGTDRGAEIHECGTHSIRITLGKELERLGTPIIARMSIMRHTDPKTSYGVYADVGLMDLWGTMNKLPGHAESALREGTTDGAAIAPKTAGKSGTKNETK